MRGNRWCGAIVCLLVWTVDVHAEETPADHRKAMEAIGAGVQAMLRPGATDDIELARRTLPALQKALATVERFWLPRHPVAHRRTTLAVKAVQDLGVAIEFRSVEGVSAAMKDLQGTCASCHAEFRDPSGRPGPRGPT